VTTHLVNRLGLRKVGMDKHFEAILGLEQLPSLWGLEMRSGLRVYESRDDEPGSPTLALAYCATPLRAHRGVG